MAYTDIDKPSDYFNTKLYTGTGSSNSITGIGFAPDWVWIKNRGASAHHMLFDKVRDATKSLYSNLTDAETTVSGHVTSFDSDGFTLGDNSGKGSTNGNTETYASWNWLGANGTASNSDGSITSSVSASTDAGFSIVSYTGTGSAATVGHSLGVKPSAIFIKNRSSISDWCVYFGTLGATKYLELSNTNAAGTSANTFNNTEPTSSVFTVNTSSIVNTSGDDYIAYCFAEKQGYSKFGSYIGNGNADGTFIYLGFKPAFVIAKESSEARDWQLWDNKRLGYNASGGNKNLIPNKTDVEDTYADIDILSNGFKLRNSSAADNKVSQTYIYMAFAEAPFVTSTGIPTCAR